MFTLDQIKAAHTKVVSGADFPRYIQDLKTLGVKKYETFVSDGHTHFEGNDSYALRTEPRYAAIKVNERSEADNFKQYIKSHQSGGTSYQVFCQQCAEAGVEKWEVDLTRMTCTYFDTSGKQLLQEQIPLP